MRRLALAALALLAALPGLAQAEDWSKRATERDILLKDFTFADGERMAEVKMHVTTLGTPHRDAKGLMIQCHFRLPY